VWSPSPHPGDQDLAKLYSDDDSVDHELCIREINKSTESVDNSVHNYHSEQDRRVKLAIRHNLEQKKICMNSHLQIWHFFSQAV
jgi:hypothetical protein